MPTYEQFKHTPKIGLYGSITVQKILAQSTIGASGALEHVAWNLPKDSLLKFEQLTWISKISVQFITRITMEETRETQQAGCVPASYQPVYPAPPNPYYAPPVKAGRWVRFRRLC